MFSVHMVMEPRISFPGPLAKAFLQAGGSLWGGPRVGDTSKWPSKGPGPGSLFKQQNRIPSYERVHRPPRQSFLDFRDWPWSCAGLTIESTGPGDLVSHLLCLKFAVLISAIQQTDLVIHISTLFFHILFHYGFIEYISLCCTVGPVVHQFQM